MTQEPTSALASLNPEQREAVEHFEGPILVLAGAGSGKTRVLTTRIAHLINEHGVDPSTIIAVTFTNKAAGEMRERVRRLLGHEPAGMWIGTFHSIGARLMRRHAHKLGWAPNFTIYDGDQALREVKRVMERLNIPIKKWHPKAVHAAISTAKNQLISPAQYAGLAADPYTMVVAEVYPLYQQALREQNAFDFDDLLVKPVELFLQHHEVLDTYRGRFQFVLVDEYQDTNHAQFRFLELLASEHGNLMVVGDDDQSIYGWRGADIKNILDFERGFRGARIVRLEQNYRSTARILDAANRVIAQNKKRKGKTLRTDAGPGELLTRLEALDERDEAAWITQTIEERLSSERTRTNRDFVVLYRTNSQSRALEEALRNHSIPYQIIGGTRFYERREIMDMLAYLRLISNPRDAGAFDRIVNYPRRGIGDTSRARLLTWAAEKGMAALDAAVHARDCEGLTPGASAALVAFGEMIVKYRALSLHIGVGELLEKLIDEIKVVDALQEEGPEGEERIENVKELVAGGHAFDARGLQPEQEEEEDVRADATPLDMFLQQVSLVADVDKHDPAANAVTLMTVHNAKGLEYPFVFIAGMEDGLFPLMRAYDEPEELEEERRLFYVALTRAREKVFISYARTRRRAGEVLSCVPSSFMTPIPMELIEQRVTAAIDRPRFQHQGGWRARMGGFGGGGGGRSSPPQQRPRPHAQQTADDSGGTYIDYTDAQDTPRFLKGERVRHPQFGRGVIRELTGLGADVKAVIEFDSVGRKKVVLRYANLQKEL
jgi:DNA helicase-2/ATP-dependent DNA helicase PcrA